MQRLFAEPLKVYAVVVPVLVATWLLAGLGGDNSTPSTGGWKYTVGSRSWAAFLLVLLLTMLFTIALGIHRVVRRSRVSP